VRTPCRLAVISASALVFVSACTATRHGPGQLTPSVSSGGVPALSGQPSSAAASASPSAAALPAGCSQLLPLGALQRILGFGILGQVTYLRAAPVPKSGRTGRVTCGYGTPAALPTGAVSPSATASPSGQPLVQVSYITYIDAKTAAARVQTTVEADGATAVVTEATVNGKPANILIGSTSSELVMADGARTIVVVVSPEVLAPGKAPAALKAIAESMLRFDRPAAPPSGSAAPAVSSS
jgi:hypothetical protein